MLLLFYDARSGTISAIWLAFVSPGHYYRVAKDGIEMREPINRRCRDERDDRSFR